MKPYNANKRLKIFLFQQFMLFDCLFFTSFGMFIVGWFVGTRSVNLLVVFDRFFLSFFFSYSFFTFTHSLVLLSHSVRLCVCVCLCLCVLFFLLLWLQCGRIMCFSVNNMILIPNIFCSIILLLFVPASNNRQRKSSLDYTMIFDANLQCEFLRTHLTQQKPKPKKNLSRILLRIRI